MILTDNQETIALIRNDAKEPLKEPGKATLKLSPIQRTIFNTETGINKIMIKDVHIVPGKYILDAWYKPVNGPRILPFYVNIE